ncbi:MAG: cytochrome P450 [Bacteroidetes bacterium]|nr:cytochrome P450 [Bacteroidota bacterium]
MASVQHPPGPRGNLLAGHLARMRRDPLPFLTQNARTYGDIVFMRLATIPVYLLSHPDDIEYVLLAANRKFIKPRLLRDAGEVLGNGLLTSEGDLWLRQRRLMQPAFHRDRINAYGETMVELTLHMLDDWSDGLECDIHDQMMHLTLAIVVRTLFGTDIGMRGSEVGAALNVALERFVDRLSLKRLLDSIPFLPRNRRFQRARARLDEIIYEIINQRRSNPGGTDLLSLLLAARDEDGSRMDDRQLRDEAITLFLAGHETTAIALTWTWYLLAQHPEVEEKLTAELDRELGGAPPAVADLSRLRYTEMVVKESMRLYPPAWRIGREAIEECTIRGYRIPQGAQVVMSQWIVHRDPRFFADADQFRPERWEDIPGTLPRYAYFPFGGGARRCIGDTFAMMEARLIVAAVHQRFRLRLLPDQRIDLWPSITLRPRHGVRMQLLRR